MYQLLEQNDTYFGRIFKDQPSFYKSFTLVPYVKVGTFQSFFIWK